MPSNRIGRALSLLSVFALVVIVFSALVSYDFSLKALWQDALLAGHALTEKYRFQIKTVLGREKWDRYANLWFKSNRKESGVTVYDRQLASEGLTFYSDHSASAFLIDMDGNVVHKWNKPYSEVWPEPEHLLYSVPDNLVYWRKAELLPNGDILAIYEGINQAPYGGGIIRLDKDSNLIWKVGLNAHHDLEVSENGTILVLTHRYTKSAVGGNRIIADGLVLISPEGRVIREDSLLPLIYGSKYRDLIPWEERDPFHTNNVEALSEELAPKFPMFNAGDVMISMYAPSAVFVLNGEDLRPIWALNGVTIIQHDPDFMPDGTIRIFDNMGLDKPEVGRSRLVDIDPSDKSITWSYEGTSSEPFHSFNRGSHQRLDGGNILITESTTGRVFEITPRGKLVWEYISPSLESGSIGVVNWATRHRRADLPFLNGK
jgi:hypothetical protein